MRKFRNGLILFATVFIIVHLVFIDYTNLGWSENSGNFLGIFSMVLLIISMVYSNRYEKKIRE
ncbi:MAG: hypothetical protein N4A71_23600 [Carboxylicivirga sp.]|jgi:hypothetical protein|nr:hypothetical protein [Carboxylicivirga sp.]MCT4643339.1 hypothetical protein [Carboxylicivirga sp.]